MKIFTFQGKIVMTLWN